MIKKVLTVAEQKNWVSTKTIKQGKIKQAK